MRHAPSPRSACAGSAGAPRHAAAVPRAQQPRRRSVATPAPAAVAAPSSQQQLLVVGHTVPQQYYPAADLHAVCFDHAANTPAKQLWARFERIWALQINDDLCRRGAGRCVLLVAFDPDAAPPEALAAAAAAAATLQATADGGSDGASSSSSSSSSSASSSASSSSSGELVLPEPFTFPQLGYWLSRLVERSVWPGLGTTYEQLGIVGVAQVDDFGDLVPPRSLDLSRDGAFGWVRREGIAYISNVAVSPAARRRGVAGLLMAEAEALAAAWGCSRAGLHCNPSNAPAMALYRQLRYRKSVLEPPWMPYLQGRAPDRCFLMLKRLPARAPAALREGEAAAA